MSGHTIPWPVTPIPLNVLRLQAQQVRKCLAEIERHARLHVEACALPHSEIVHHCRSADLLLGQVEAGLAAGDPARQERLQGLLRRASGIRRCGHSACSTHYIETGDDSCVEGIAAAMREVNGRA